MAGLGEVCTHVAAVIFYIEAVARLNGIPTCTQKECQWMIPTYQRDIPYAPLSKIDFSSAKSNKRALDTTIGTSCPVVSKQINPPVQQASTHDLQCFYHQLSKCSSKPAILSLVPQYAQEYIPKSSLPNFLKPLQSLHQPKFQQLNYADLLTACNDVILHLTKEMAEAVERSTHDQSNSKLWYKYRAGRVTASRMKAVCKTNASLPSQSLIKSICYPEAFRFTTSATKWGCDHERSARDAYQKLQEKKHINFSISMSGFVLNPKWPHLGASPDGFIQCDCCGKGVVEIKCPYCHCFDTVECGAIDKESYLVPDADGSLHIDCTHAYYYQIQTQLFVCNVDYGDFCVCTFPTGADPSLHVERISPDPDLWSSCIEASTQFFKFCLLPELLGNWYTKTSIPKGDPTQETLSKRTENNTPLYCYCQKPEDKTVDWIGCDNPTCSISWFHTSCLHIIAIPKGKWYCPDCRKLPEFTKNRKRKNVKE